MTDREYERIDDGDIAHDRKIEQSHCDHRGKPVECHLNFNHIEDIDRFMAEIRISCECGHPYRFIGLPAGVDYNSPTVDVGATEGRFPMAPKGEVISELEGTPIGFTIRKVQ